MATDALYVTEVEVSFTLLNNTVNGMSGRPKHFPKLSTGGSIGLYVIAVSRAYIFDCVEQFIHGILLLPPRN